MDNHLPSHKGNRQDNSSINDKADNPSAPQLLAVWDRFWTRVNKLGLSEVTMRVGSALVTLGLVGLVVWVMSGYFVGGRMASSSVQPLTAGGDEQPIAVLPAYEGVAPVEGLTRSADTHTSAASASRSRYDFETYEVVSGDTIWAIAESFELKPETLLWTNAETLRDNPAAIYPGQVLTIPPVDGVLHTWSEGEGLNAVSEYFGLTPEDIVNWPGNRLSIDTVGDFSLPNIEPGTRIFAPGGTRPFYDWSATIFTREETAESSIWGEGKCAPTNQGPIGTGTYIWPTILHGVLGYEFAPEVNHWGVDLGGGLDSPIYVVDHGVVVYAGWSEWGYGNVIAVDHGDGMQTIYAHLNSFNVGCGDFVYQGDIIGFMGSTGNSSGPHLHFEIRSGSQRLNPHNYIGN